jgi:hypothetical protein
MITVQNFSIYQRHFLISVNNKLINIESILKHEIQRLVSEGKKRIQNRNDWVQDYEIDCFVAFVLKEDDSGYDEKSDNILAQIWEGDKYEDWEWGIGDEKNHNEFQNWENHPMKDEFHCWLYRCLYSKLNWIDIMRIGQVRIDVQTIYQVNYDV